MGEVKNGITGYEDEFQIVRAQRRFKSYLSYLSFIIMFIETPHFWLHALSRN